MKTTELIQKAQIKVAEYRECVKFKRQLMTMMSESQSLYYECHSSLIAMSLEIGILQDEINELTNQFLNK